MIQSDHTQTVQISVEPKCPADIGRLTLTAEEEHLAQAIAANIREIVANEDRNRATSVERDAA